MKSSAPILIIDKTGLIGEPLSRKLSKEFPVVFVGNSPSAHVPFSRRFPTIPDNKYSLIIFIDEQGQDLEFLPKIIEKVKDVNSDFIFAQGLFSRGEYMVDKILRLCPGAKIVFYGDLFEKSRFIYQARRFGKIQILGDGLRETYPVFLNDVVDGLIDLVFGMNDKYSLFYLFPKHPPTELSLAHMIQKANPEINIDFIQHRIGAGFIRSDPRKGVISYPAHGKYLLDDKYPIAKKIRNIDIKRTTKRKDDRTPGKQPGIKRFPILIVWVLIFLIFSPLVFTLIFSFLGLNTLYFAKSQTDKGNFSNAKSSLHLSQTFFLVGKKTSDILLLQGKLIGRDQNLKRLMDDIDLGHRISEGALQAFNSEIYFSKIWTSKSKDPTDDFTKGLSLLKSSIIALEKIKAEGKIPYAFLQELEIINPLIKLLSNTVDILPGIFGMEGTRNYLILFQDNMELRPTGGFIGSYGVLKINMGKINEFVINDVYDADGQLRGHVEPPFAVRRHLPSVHWYLRDSNFDVDFVKSASASSNFLFAETGREVFGVIAIDVSFVKNILYAIGPVYVADYKETVNENNLYMLIQSHAQRNFLRSLYKTIITKVTGAKINYLLIAQAISDSLKQKHLIFAFNDSTQNIFTVNGWSSSLWDERRQDEKSVNDFLGINEANLGRNKINYFISRQISQKVMIEPSGSISEELTINYKNNSTAAPGTDYKNYLRIILPLDTTISEISIQDIPQVLADAVTDPLVYEKKNFKPPLGLEVERTIEEEKTIYGFPVNIPAGELTKIKIKYSVQRKNTFDSGSFSYNLKIFKQPGIDNLPYSFSLEFPNSYRVTQGKTSYSKKIVKDESLIVNFAKN